MNRKQRKRHKQAVKRSQEYNRKYNKAHSEDAIYKKEKHRLESLQRLNRRDKIKLKRIKKKRIQSLKSQRRKGFITVEKYQEEIKAIK